MKIALFGATGTIGRRILNEALERGHSVTAIVRDPARLDVQHPNLTTVVGNQLDAQSVADSVGGHDAVITSYAPPQGSETTIVEATRSLFDGLRRAGVKRVIAVGGAGSLDVAPGLQLVDAPVFPASYRPIALAHRDALDVYKAEAGDLEWTNFSPAAIIEPGERTGSYRVGTDQLVADADGNSRITAEDYAIALLDELETPKYVGKRFTAAH